MSYISTQYDPAWEAFKAAHPGPQESAEYKSEEQKSQDLLNQIYSTPRNQRQYLGTGQFNQMFPELQKYGQQVSDWEKSTEQLFQQQYGHSPILGTTVSGPPMTGGIIRGFSDPTVSQPTPTPTPAPTPAPAPVIPDAPPPPAATPPPTTLKSILSGMPNFFANQQQQTSPLPWDNQSAFGSNSPYTGANSYYQNTSFYQ